MSAIRHQINIAAPIRTVWTALTTADGLMSWWADEARIDPRPGGRVVVTTEDDDGKTFTYVATFDILRDEFPSGGGRSTKWLLVTLGIALMGLLARWV